MLFQVLIVVMVAVLSMGLYCTVWYGVQSRKLGGLIKGHKSWATFTFWWMIATVIVVELGIRSGQYESRGILFYVHLPFAFALLITILSMRFLFNGQNWPKTHRLLSYACYLSAAIALPTGIILAFR